jgi:hypothetical protein
MKDDIITGIGDALFGFQAALKVVTVLSFTASNFDIPQ